MYKNSEADINYLPRGECPICGSSKNHDIHIHFPEIPVVRCRSCSHIFSARLMAGDKLAEYYQKEFGSERHRQGQLINAKTNAWAIKRLLNINSVHNFLDVGAGYGFLLKELRDRIGLKAIGVELSQKEANYGLKYLNVDLRNCMLSDAKLKKASFDVVACFEVIEHITNPKEFINELVQYLKPDGHLLLMTDNFESNVAKDLGAGFPKWIPHSHISHFGPSALEKVLQDNGLQITRCMSYTPWELLARNCYYKLRGIQRSPQESFNLTATLGSEMHGTFSFFPLRRLINVLWAKLTVRDDLNGALMYALAKRKPV